MTNFHLHEFYRATPSACGWLSPWSPCGTLRASAWRRWGEWEAPWWWPASSAPCWPEGTWGASRCCGRPGYSEGSWKCACRLIRLKGRRGGGGGGGGREKGEQRVNLTRNAQRRWRARKCARGKCWHRKGKRKCVAVNEKCMTFLASCTKRWSYRNADVFGHRVFCQCERGICWTRGKVFDTLGNVLCVCVCETTFHFCQGN